MSDGVNNSEVQSQRSTELINRPRWFDTGSIDVLVLRLEFEFQVRLT
jgi:hypothetical protein